MRLHVVDSGLFVTDCRTRLPFRFGAVTMTEAPLCLAMLEIETEDGRRTRGYSSDLLVPKWFDKDPAKSPQENSRDLLASAHAAARAFRDEPPSTVFDSWWSVYQQRVESQPFGQGDQLVRGFGVALCERALMDAACRAADVSFFTAWRQDLFAFQPHLLYAALAGWSLSASLAEAPATRVRVRHTIGLTDALREAELETPLNDGFPQALKQDIAVYGLDTFKVKIGGGHDVDVARLQSLAEFFDDTLDDYQVTVDGNEQFHTLDELVALFEAVGRDPHGRRLLERLQYIEQPLHRDATFDPQRNRAMAHVSDIAPVIIDEADCALEALPRALELGYSGISVKNCKGVFRAMASRGLCEATEGAFQSAEDLTNLPAVALQQDLATVATLGLPHVERNGHHYFRGLDHLSEREIEYALAEHPELYTRHDGGARLDIQAGELKLHSLQRSGYGAVGDPDLERE